LSPLRTSDSGPTVDAGEVVVDAGIMGAAGRRPSRAAARWLSACPPVNPGIPG
jgi:hypothetical protein